MEQRKFQKKEEGHSKAIVTKERLRNLTANVKTIETMTVRDLLADLLNDEDYNKACANIINEKGIAYLSKEVKEDHDVMNYSMAWSLTKEGYMFWRKKYKEIHGYYLEDRINHKKN